MIHKFAGIGIADWDTPETAMEMETMFRDTETALSKIIDNDDAHAGYDFLNTIADHIYHASGGYVGESWASPIAITAALGTIMFHSKSKMQVDALIVQSMLSIKLRQRRDAISDEIRTLQVLEGDLDTEWRNSQTSIERVKRDIDFMTELPDNTAKMLKHMKALNISASREEVEV